MPLPRDHSCVEHARFKQADWVETHGLDCGPYERGTDEWWECSVCHDKYTQSELDQIAKQEETERLIRESEAESDEATRRANAAFEARYCGGDGWTGEE